MKKDKLKEVKSKKDKFDEVAWNKIVGDLASRRYDFVIEIFLKNGKKISFDGVHNEIAIKIFDQIMKQMQTPSKFLFISYIDEDGAIKSDSFINKEEISYVDVVEY